jgi:NAD(P)-dependent dehydrogenase (short-subunit alcohol dehydrogenase family)
MTDGTKGERVESRTLLVVGAGGDVGRGIVAAALQSRRNVIAAGRSAGPLADLTHFAGPDRLATVQGNLSDEVEAQSLWDAACAPFGEVHEVVVSVNAAAASKPLLEMSSADMAQSLAGNVLTHFVAAKTFLPRLQENGMFIGIGGGTADFIFPGLAPVSMAQAALRMLYRGLAKERKSGAQLRELMIVSMVAGKSNRDTARPDWVTDLDVGKHVCAILDAPEVFPKPVLHLHSREQVGQPENEA